MEADVCQLAATVSMRVLEAKVVGTINMGRRKHKLRKQGKGEALANAGSDSSDEATTQAPPQGEQDGVMFS